MGGPATPPHSRPLAGLRAGMLEIPGQRGKRAGEHRGLLGRQLSHGLPALPCSASPLPSSTPSTNVLTKPLGCEKDHT